jgi:hypothetical protein
MENRPKTAPPTVALLGVKLRCVRTIQSRVNGKGIISNSDGSKWARLEKQSKSEDGDKFQDALYTIHRFDTAQSRLGSCQGEDPRRLTGLNQDPVEFVPYDASQASFTSLR